MLKQKLSLILLLGASWGAAQAQINNSVIDSRLFLPEVRDFIKVHPTSQSQPEQDKERTFAPTLRFKIAVDSSDDREYKIDLLDAAKVWNDRLGENAFVLNSDAAANVTIVLTKDVFQDGVAVAGLSTWSRDSQGHYHALVKVRTRLPNGKAVNDATEINIALHEMGHLLGLEDSNSHGHVMSPLNLNRLLSAPSEEEVKAVRYLRLNFSASAVNAS